MPVRIVQSAQAAYGYPLLIKQLLHTPLATCPEQEIVYRDQYRFSYLGFNRRLKQLANALTQCGVEAGSTVAIMDWDSHRYLECYFAVPMMGAVLQTINVRLAPEQILYTLQDSQADIILFHRDFLPLVESIKAELPQVKTFVFLTDEGKSEEVPVFARGEYETLLGDEVEEYHFPDFDENALATTFHTTGTTGLPKAVCYSHRQLVLHTLSTCCAFSSSASGHSFRQDDVYMPMTPMFHVHAWGIPYVATLMGVKQVYPGRYQAEELIALRRREGVSYSHCVPTILQMILAAAKGSEDDLQGWKLTIGGSALSPHLAQEALDAGMDVYAGYGMSETGPVLTVSQPKQSAGSPDEDFNMEQRCSAGTPIPLVDLQLVDEDMTKQAWDGQSPGELVVRAPWTTPCYLNKPADSESLWRGHYLHTADVATIDAAGVVQITDRIKDVIKSGGEWLSSLQLENLICRHPHVAEAAVVGVPDPRWGERPHAFIVAPSHSPSPLEPDDLRRHLKAYAEQGLIPVYGIPENWTVIDTLPKTSVGKIDKRSLREQLAKTDDDQ